MTDSLLYVCFEMPNTPMREKLNVIESSRGRGFVMCYRSVCVVDDGSCKFSHRVFIQIVSSILLVVLAVEGTWL